VLSPPCFTCRLGRFAERTRAREIRAAALSRATSSTARPGEESNKRLGLSTQITLAVLETEQTFTTWKTQGEIRVRNVPPGERAPDPPPLAPTARQVLALAVAEYAHKTVRSPGPGGAESVPCCSIPRQRRGGVVYMTGKSVPPGHRAPIAHRQYSCGRGVPTRISANIYAGPGGSERCFVLASIHAGPSDGRAWAGALGVRRAESAVTLSRVSAKLASPRGPAAQS